MDLPFGVLTFLNQELAWGDLLIVGLLVLLEGVLSIDNALVLGILAKRLPKHLRPRALSYGLIGAFVFRVIAIATASFLLQWTFVKFLGGAYLVFIAVKHLFFESKEEEDGKLVLGEDGQPKLVDAETGGELSSEEEDIEIKERVPIGTSLVTGDETNGNEAVAAKSKTQKFPSFWGTVLVIELTDIAFAVDSILAAMALAGSRTEKLWVVITGGILGVVLMRFAAALFIRMLDRFPRFELSAYLLVIVIGVKLLADWGCNSDWSFQQSPWLAKGLGSYQQTFIDFEAKRRTTVSDYEHWLQDNWPIPLPPPHSDTASHSDDTSHSEETPHAEDQNANPSETPAEVKVKLPPHIPHLLDFHDLRRPECMTFWILMAVCFGVGFLPKKKHS